MAKEILWFKVVYYWGNVFSCPLNFQTKYYSRCETDILIVMVNRLHFKEDGEGLKGDNIHGISWVMVILISSFI